MRVAVAGFMHESNTFNPLPADRAAFQAQSLLFGADLIGEFRQAHHEVGGFLEGLERLEHEVLPLVMAWATPSGPVTDAVFDEVVGAIEEGLQRQRPDGLLLALHGAMVVQSELDGDGAVLRRLRRVVGPDFPIVVTLDLHGNISSSLADGATAALAYRTNPHVDQRQRGLQAADLLHRTLRGEIRPVTALAQPPLIMNIMRQDTSRDPFRKIQAEARQVEERPGILAASVLAGFPYADVPQMGPSVLVVADGDFDLALEQAERLGEVLWSLRAEMVADLPDAAAAVSQALAEEKTPVVLVDTGDNIGGGSAGDGTVLLAELLRQQASNAVVCLYAPEEVAVCAAAGIGGSVRLRVGGKVDRLHGEPVAVEGRVKVLHDGNYIEPQARHGGRRHQAMGTAALVEMDRGNLLVLTSQRHPPFSLGHLTCLGIQSQLQRILVVKAAIAYRAAFLPVAGTILEVNTPGLTAVDPRRFDYRHIRRPMYPLDACEP